MTVLKSLPSLRLAFQMHVHEAILYLVDLPLCALFGNHWPHLVMMLLTSYSSPIRREEADRNWPRLSVR